MVWRNGRGGWASVRFLDESFYQHPGDAQSALDQVRDMSIGISVDLSGCIRLNRGEQYLEQLSRLLSVPDCVICAVVLDDNDMNDLDAEVLSRGICGNNGSLRSISLLGSRFSERGMHEFMRAIADRDSVVEIRMDLREALPNDVRRFEEIAAMRGCQSSEWGLSLVDGSWLRRGVSMFR